MRVTGAEGHIAWGYHIATTLRAWSLSRDEGQLTLTATVVTSDTFRLSQQPLVFVAQRQNGSWRWPVHTLQISDGTLIARLGPQET